MKKQITYQDLNEIKYKDLEKELATLGVSDAWSGGKKKDDIIKDALSKLAMIDKLKEDGVEDIDKAIELINISKEEDAQKIIEENSVEEIVEVEKPRLTKDQINFALDNIEKNLKNGVASHRVILLNKKSELMKMLSLLD